MKSIWNYYTWIWFSGATELSCLFWFHFFPFWREKEIQEIKIKLNSEQEKAGRRQITEWIKINEMKLVGWSRAGIQLILSSVCNPILADAEAKINSQLFLLFQNRLN